MKPACANTMEPSTNTSEVFYESDFVDGVGESQNVADRRESIDGPRLVSLYFHAAA